MYVTVELLFHFVEMMAVVIALVVAIDNNNAKKNKPPELKNGQFIF